MEITKHVDQYRKDLEFKNYAESSIENYVSQVTGFLYHFNGKFTDASRINETAIKEWLMEATSINGRKHRISAVKLFYQLTIKQPLKFKHIKYPRSETKLPIVLSVEEVQKMFDNCINTKHRVIMGLLYSTGMRVSELINLKWEHIDRSRMIINIIQAKGNKDRQVTLSADLIPLLEKYWNEYHSKDFVLNGQVGLQYTARSVGEVIKQLAEKAGINKRVYTHLMRHNCFTHLMESGVDINLIQRLAGHKNVKTTSIYCHISHNLISGIQSPLQNIRL